MPRRKVWTTEETKIVLDHFSLHIKRGALPGKVLCEELMKKHPVLQERKWSDLKFCCKNYITKLNRMKK